MKTRGLSRRWGSGRLAAALALTAIPAALAGGEVSTAIAGAGAGRVAAEADATAFAADGSPRPLLVTVDDLPLAGRAPEDPAARAALTEELLAALRRHGIRAIGFVTWSRVSVPSDLTLLARWLEEGHELGNHSDRHPSLTDVTAEAFLEDAERARRELATFLAKQGRSLRLYRYPFLREGDTPAKLAAVRRWLAETGQTAVPVTIDNQDWSFDEPWREAVAAGDVARQAELAEDYHAALRLAVRHHEARGDRLLGRATPQVLLLHANAVGAAQWDRLFGWLERTEHRFAGADEVLADPVFGAPPAVLASHGFGLWDRLRQQRGEAHAREQALAHLTAQAEAWSRGDLEGFVSGYAEDIRYAAPSGLVEGRAALVARYRQRYPDARAMGRLSFDPLDVRVGSGVEFTPAGDAVPGRVHGVSVLARWAIEREGGEPASGVTLVVLQRRGDGWAIVQDLSF